MDQSATQNPNVRALLDKTLKNLRFVEGGSFQMGDFGPLHAPDKLYYSFSTDNKPAHKVTLDSFSMSAYKTTYADHDVYAAATGKPRVGLDEITKRVRHPEAAAGMNWHQAREYCQWLGKQLNLPMDLPTEAQWEYAARARGQFFLFATDNGKMEEPRNVWEYDQRNAYAQKHNLEGAPSMPLGQFPPTPLGLYDMMTDGYEWTLDWYSEKYYEVSPEHNPKGPDTGTERVLRSYVSSSGAHMAYGDGMSITRHKRHPDPPKINHFTRKPDSSSNMTRDTMSRCVVNHPKPISAP